MKINVTLSVAGIPSSKRKQLAVQHNPFVILKKKTIKLTGSNTVPTATVDLNKEISNKGALPCHERVTNVDTVAEEKCLNNDGAPISEGDEENVNRKAAVESLLLFTQTNIPCGTGKGSEEGSNQRVQELRELQTASPSKESLLQNRFDASNIRLPPQWVVMQLSSEKGNCYFAEILEQSEDLCPVIRKSIRLDARNSKVFFYINCTSVVLDNEKSAEVTCNEDISGLILRFHKMNLCPGIVCSRYPGINSSVKGEIRSGFWHSKR